MHEVGMQEQVGDKLIQVEIVGHEEMQATDVGQIDTTQL
jgi:hypothetical protein